MNEELMALSRRAIACTNWRWVPGMTAWRLTHRDEWVQIRIVKGLDTNLEFADPDHTDSKKLLVASGHSVINGWYRIGDLLPNLTDPATLGCLLQIVRDTYGDSEAHLVLGAGGWVLMSGESRVANVVYSKKASNTESEALVAALEAANE